MVLLIIVAGACFCSTGVEFRKGVLVYWFMSYCFSESVCFRINFMENCTAHFICQISLRFPFAALTLLVRRQEGHRPVKKVGCWIVGRDIL